MSTVPTAAARPSPTARKTTSWASATAPMPMIFPASSGRGPALASSTSTTREAFSSTMPDATQ
jgi:hypothetical protein